MTVLIMFFAYVIAVMFGSGGSPLSREVEDIVVADVVLSVSFALALSGGIFGIKSSIGSFLPYLAISFVAVSCSFVLHELMHKFAAQHFGYPAGFRRSDTGLMIGVVLSLFGALVAMPGATMIYTSSISRDEDGIISLAGPLTNFAVFLAFFALSILIVNPNLFVQTLLSFTMLISLVLACFNMLPIYPLDGSKVLRWQPAVYVAVIAVIFFLLYKVLGATTTVEALAFWLVAAFVMSQFYRAILF